MTICAPNTIVLLTMRMANMPYLKVSPPLIPNNCKNCDVKQNIMTVHSTLIQIRSRIIRCVIMRIALVLFSYFNVLMIERSVSVKPSNIAENPMIFWATTQS